MSAEVVERVLRSSRYRDVDRGLVERLAREESGRARNADDAVKRVKRRLHQAVGAFRGSARGGVLGGAWHGDLADAGFRAACIDVMRTHASTRERIPHLDRFHAAIREVTGAPRRLLDVGCGLGPLALPWMAVADATYLASDVDDRALGTVRGFLELVGQPHDVALRDAVIDPPRESADLALLLKLVTTLDRQDPGAATRLLRVLDVRHAVVTFATRSLGGRARGMERTYRDRLDRLVDEAGRVTAVTEVSVPNELAFVLALEPLRG
jgi:16S rRNA (guanine(1405)-N(7))-methyltransferase